MSGLAWLVRLVTRFGQVGPTALESCLIISWKVHWLPVSTSMKSCLLDRNFMRKVWLTSVNVCGRMAAAIAIQSLESDFAAGIGTIF